MRGYATVQAKDATGNTGYVDAMDLDEDSFRAWTIWMMCRVNRLIGVTNYPDTQIELRVKPGIVITPNAE